MLADLIEHLTEERRKRIFRRASMLGIGPYKKWMNGPDPLPAPSKPVYNMEMKYPAYPTFEISSGFTNLADSAGRMTFTMRVAGLTFEMNLDQRGIEKPYVGFHARHSSLHDLWVSGMSPLNRRIAEHMVTKFSDAILDTPLIEETIARERRTSPYARPIDAETLIAYCKKNLETLKAHLPENQDVKIYARPSHALTRPFKDIFKKGLSPIKESDIWIENSPGDQYIKKPLPLFEFSPAPMLNLPKFRDPEIETYPLYSEGSEDIISKNSLVGQFRDAARNFQFKKAPEPVKLKFEDAQVEVRGIPVFKKDPGSFIRLQYAAFELQRHGVRYWVQFTDINGCDTTDFMMVEYNENNSQQQRQMYKSEALSALKIIKEEMSDPERWLGDHPSHPWVGDVLHRLTRATEDMEDAPIDHVTPAEMNSLEKIYASFMKSNSNHNLTITGNQ